MEKDDYQFFQQVLTDFLGCLGQCQGVPECYQFDSNARSVRNEGLMTSSKVQYVAKGANFRRLGYDYSGSLKVLETILRYDYLWTKVRVQGGAYGGFAQFDKNGNMVFGSYRDPNLKETLAVYDQTAQYLRDFQVTEREMTKYIIGTMSQLDTPLTPQQKGERAAVYYMRKILQADVQKERDEILATKPENIVKLADLVDAAMKQNYLCVLGNEQKIKDNEDEFGQLVSVFE
jgi:Zn-dependent M16 (insulinase) family peptidase